MTDLDYTGKRILVTGGATGVGAALLDLLAELGASDVTVLDIKQPTGPHATFIQTDLSDKAGVDAAIAGTAGPIDALFNNAGVADTLPPEVVFKVNALALRHLSESLLPQIREGGTIVNTASIAGAQWPAHLQDILELLAVDDWDAGLEWFTGQRAGRGHLLVHEGSGAGVHDEILAGRSRALGAGQQRVPVADRHAAPA